MHEDLLRGRELQATMSGGEGEDVSRRASAKVESRTVRAVPSFSNLHKIPERPVHKATAVPVQGTGGPLKKKRVF